MQARERANPLARPPPRTPSSRPGGSGGAGSSGAQATGVAYGIRGSAAGAGAPGKGKNRVVGEAQGAPAVNAKTAGVLRQFLASRWSEQAQFLNLEVRATPGAWPPHTHVEVPCAQAGVAQALG